MLDYLLSIEGEPLSLEDVSVLLDKLPIDKLLLEEEPLLLDDIQKEFLEDQKYR